MRRRRRGEEGAVAIITGILAVTLVSVSALAVDLGNAYSQKADMQSRTDFSALAGGNGSNLPAPTPSGSTCTSANSWTAPSANDQAVKDVASYLNGFPGGNVTAAQLVDCDLTNGEVGYGSWSAMDPSNGYKRTFTPDNRQISVISQRATVTFGLATVMGFKDVKVYGVATAQIDTKLQSTLPLYAFQGCDYGLQTIAQPTNGQSSSGVNLANGSDSNNYISETGITVSPASTTTPPSVALNSSTSTVTIAGTNLDKVTSVGFFESATTNPPAPTQVAKASFTSQSATSITVTIPTAVTGTQDTWFVRVIGTNKQNNGSPEWTPVTQNGNANASNNLAAYPFVVGNATLSCNQGSTSGNFGTLDLFNRSANAPSGQADNIAYNIATGLQFGLAPYPKAFWHTTNNYICNNGDDNGVGKTWPAPPNTTADGSGTNCVGTKPGLDSQAAQEGLVDGLSSPTVKGLLANTSSSTFCPNDAPTGTSHVAYAKSGPLINNDVLSCYFENSTVTVGDVSSATYSGGAVLDQSIYKSPRFVLVPVLGYAPGSGASNNYQIVDFRPGFITDQVATATKGAGPGTTTNGLVWSNNNKLQAVNVVFLNNAALHDPPLDANGKYIPYTGSGKKSLLLVN